ncbi:hypothetical protein CE91St41_03020 [Oscillospiraceae bacterium]|nr:hypothetical protein CE91St40_03020 [Oscillospiraceae bacterium]BDF73413.1 hypothetical protein CE91St41_03020 [Oscillospiraceae bacterium]
MDLKVSDMMDMQRELWELHRDKWSPMEPEYGRNFLLWMVEELGEVIAIVKKKGDAAIAADPAVRGAFTEEMSDVLMYFMDTLLRYGVSPQEFSEAYLNKHGANMGRDYDGQYARMFTGGQDHGRG